MSRWPLGLVACALVLGQLPLLLAACCAPPDATGLGTTWFINDFAQYESAMRQGAEQPGWLIYDAFTAEPHQPAFMFPLYVGLGKVAAVLGLPFEVLERLTEMVARALLVLAVWRFAHAFADGPKAALVACLLALFGGGFTIAAAAGGASYTGNWSYETNTFGLLFAAPHVPLAMAGTLELARLGLLPQRQLSAPRALAAGALAAGIALLHPFHMPVLLAAMLGAGAVFWRTNQGGATLVLAAAALIGAMPPMAYSAATFGFDLFWSAAYNAQNRLPSPAPHELIVDLGPTLLLAIAGAFVLRGRAAPFGLLLWLMLALVAMYLPVPFQRRLGFGLQPMLAIVAANGLVALVAAMERRWAMLLRLGVVAASASGTALVLVSIVASSLRNTPLPVYRSTRELDAAARWLDAQAQPGDVVFATWDAMNYLAPRTPARTFGGHPVATLNAGQKQLAVASVFAHGGSSAEIARRLGATWLVYGPGEAGPADGQTPVFEDGSVRVYRLAPE